MLNNSVFVSAEVIQRYNTGKKLPRAPSRESNSGLPYSKPTHYQLRMSHPLSYAAPYELPRTLMSYAAPHKN